MSDSKKNELPPPGLKWKEYFIIEPGQWEGFSIDENGDFIITDMDKVKHLIFDKENNPVVADVTDHVTTDIVTKEVVISSKEEPKYDPISHVILPLEDVPLGGKNFITSLLLIGAAGIFMIFFLMEIFFYMFKDNIEDNSVQSEIAPHFEIAKD